MYVCIAPSLPTNFLPAFLPPQRSPRTSFGLLQFGFYPSHPSILHPFSSDPLLRGLALHPCAPSSPPTISLGFSFFFVWCVSLSPRPYVPIFLVQPHLLFACNQSLQHIEGHLQFRAPLFCCLCWHPRTCSFNTKTDIICLVLAAFT